MYRIYNAEAAAIHLQTDVYCPPVDWRTYRDMERQPAPITLAPIPAPRTEEPRHATH